MKQITLNKINLNLSAETQISPSGRPIRLSAISKNLQVPQKFVNGEYKNHWIYTFRYLDAKDGFVSFEFDYEDKFLCKVLNK
jgi:hypothetical protein